MTTTDVSETVSEKPKRGRPRLIPGYLREMYDRCGLWTEVKTERGRQNIHYRQRGLELAFSDPEAFRWLADGEAMKRGEAKAWKPGVLAELGRIEDDELMRAAALAVCKARPRGRDAIARVRRFRLGKDGVGSADALRAELIRHVNDYLTRFPGTPWPELAEAARGLLDAVEGSAPAAAPDDAGAAFRETTKAAAG